MIKKPKNINKKAIINQTCTKLHFRMRGPPPLSSGGFSLMLGRIPAVLPPSQQTQEQYHKLTMAASFHVLFFSTNETINRRQGLGTVHRAREDPCQERATCAYARYLAKDELLLSIVSTFAQYIFYTLLEILEVYSLCTTVQRFLAPTNSSIVTPPTARSSLYRARLVPPLPQPHQNHLAGIITLSVKRRM